WAATGVEGGQALVDACLARVVGGGQIDCILLDWRMPGMDGIEAIARLGDWLDTERMPVVIMVTAYDRDALIRAAAEVRPHGVLTKPVNPSALFNTVNEAVYVERHDLSQVILGTRVDVSHSLWLKGARVLVVDDSRMNLDVVSRILVHEGAIAICCELGDEAVSVLAANAAHFDAVLMDLQMPGMDGCEATRAIRRLPGCRRLPVIALTAGATTTEKARADAAGMTGFLSKPVDPVRLVRTLREQIEANRGEPLPLHPRDADSADTGAWPELPGIDIDAVRARLGNDLALFRQLMQACAREFATVLDEIDTLAGRGELPGVADRAHKLHGQLGNIGAGELARLAGQIERSARAGRTLDRALFERFASAVARLGEAVSVWTATAATPAPAVAQVDLERLEPLIARLRRDLADQKMSALGLCDQLLRQLQGSAHDAAGQALAQAVSGLRFKAALRALDALVDTAGRTGEAPDDEA
ncbi:MAG: hybrid sensor histidine kinase/response regulator, partial [Proteobacteria bacterium]